MCRMSYRSEPLFSRCEYVFMKDCQYCNIYITQVSFSQEGEKRLEK